MRGPDARRRRAPDLQQGRLRHARDLPRAWDQAHLHGDQRLLERGVMSAAPEKWGVLARRSSGSVCGAATAWCKDGTSPTGLLLFDSHEKARTMAEHYNARTVSPNVSYVA